MDWITWGPPPEWSARCRTHARARIWFVTVHVATGEPSAADAIAKVDDAIVTFENSDPFQFALFDAEMLKQPPPIAHQNGDQVNLELVEEPRGEGALGD